MCVATSWVDSGGPLGGLLRKRCCRTQDMEKNRKDPAQRLGCVNGRKGHIWEKLWGKCLHSLENREEILR